MSEKEFPYQKIMFGLRNKYNVSPVFVYEEIHRIWKGKNNIDLDKDNESFYPEFYKWFIPKYETYIKSIVILIKL